MFQRIDVALDQEQVGTTLDGQEARSRNIDTAYMLEMPDCSSSCGFQLQDDQRTLSRIRLTHAPGLLNDHPR